MDRQPIKIRKPIFKPSCTCYGTVVAVEGKPYYLDITETPYHKLDQYLKKAEGTTTLYTEEFLEPISTYAEQKVLLALENKIPVAIKTNQIVPANILEAMREVPHCSLHININFLDDSLSKMIAPHSDGVFDLREMMFLAKAWRISSVLQIDYMPHLFHELDLYELLEITKVYAPHVLVHFKDFTYDEYLTSKSLWESIAPSSLQKFNECYEMTPEGGATVSEAFKEKFLPELKEFASSRKVGIEVLGSWASVQDKVRHLKTTNTPFGMRPFFYTKVDNKFVESPTIQEPKPCEECGKQRFI